MLTLGEPDAAAAPGPLASLKDSVSAGNTRYTLARGTPAAVAAVAGHASRLAGAPISEARVTVLAGTQNALFATALCVLDGGDDAILLDPAYSTYRGVMAATGANVVSVPLRPEDRWHPDLEAIAAAVTPRTRAILATSPGNPTGATMTADDLAGLIDLCERHDLYVIVDEVYGLLDFGRQHTSVLAIPGAETRAIAISSVSKSHALTGLRVGWAVAPEPIAEGIEQILEAMLYGCPHFIQDALVTALADSETPAALRASFGSRARLVAGLLDGRSGIRCPVPEGGMFALVDIRGCGMSAPEFANRLLDEESVATLPGEGFGTAAAGHLRLGLVQPEDVLEEACRRIVRFAGNVTARDVVLEGTRQWRSQ